jgi:bifunctional DNase/RNase
MEGFERVVVYGVSCDRVTKQPIVLLKVEDKNRLFPIWIGHPETVAILMKLRNATCPRPLTHDLVASVIANLSASLERVLITEVRDNTVYAVLQLVAGDEEIDVDSRPSDAIALAMRVDAPIFTSSELLETGGIEFEPQKEDVEEVVEEFQRFLDKASPEDF